MVNKENPYARKLKVWAWVTILFCAIQSIACSVLIWHIYVFKNEIPYETSTVVLRICTLTGLSHPVIFLWGIYLILRMVAHSCKSSGLPWKHLAVQYSAVLFATIFLHIYFFYGLRLLDYID